MKKLGVLVGIIACLIFTFDAVAGDPGRIAKGRRIYGEVNLPLAAFMIGFDTTTGLAGGTAISGTTTPGREQDDMAGSVVWADGETTPAQTTFKVPSDYDGDGRFLVGVTNANVTTPNFIDFDVIVAAPGAASGSTTNQTVVTCADATAGYLDFVTLTPVTSFDSLAAGDDVTFRIWRDDADAAGYTPTADLEVKSVTFIYTQIGD